MGSGLMALVGWFFQNGCGTNEPSHIEMQGLSSSVMFCRRHLNTMGLPNSDVIMKRFVPVSLSAALSLAALLPLTATPLLAHDDDRYDNREYLYSPEISAQPAAWGQQNSDTNSCVEGSVIGGLLGAGLGAALSRGNGRWIGMPLGGAAGALIGCQVDGG